MVLFLNIFVCTFIACFTNFVGAEPLIVKIGASLPLSGDRAYVGRDIIRGLELAKRDFDSDKINFQIIAEDDGHQGKNAASAGMKLISIDKVDIIISLWDMSEIIAPMAEKKQIPHFAIRWNPHVAEQFNYTMTIESTYLSYLKSWSELLAKMKINTVSIIKEEALSWNIGFDYFKSLLKEKGISVLSVVNYLPSELDHRGLVLNSLKIKPDMVLLLANPPNDVSLIKKIKEFSLTQRFSGYFEIIEDLDLIENSPFVAQLEPAPWFIQKFDEAYHSKIAARAPQAYDVIALINDSYKGSTIKLSGAEVVAHITGVSSFPGASGVLNSKGSRTVEMDCVWKVVRNGKLEIYNGNK